MRVFTKLDFSATSSVVVGIRTLRQNYPSWSWRLYRGDTGWEYEGVKDDRKVKVFSLENDRAISWHIEKNGLQSNFSLLSEL